MAFSSGSWGLQQSPFSQVRGHPPHIATPNHTNSRGASRLSYSGRPGSLGWILLVLYVAYAGQVLGGLLFGSSLSAFVGAAVMTPVAVFVATQRTGPPTLVTFLPAFWLLVPGAIALVGVTQVMGEARWTGCRPS